MQRYYTVVILLVLTYVATGQDITASKPDEPIDTSHFEHATKSPYFVDKTMLLKDFLRDQPVLITRPRNFGKTTNLDMVRRFFQVSFDAKTGEKIDKNTTHYYELFTDISLKLQIASDKSFIDNHMGEYPVIYIDFANTRGISETEITNYTLQNIAHAFEPYRCVVDKFKKKHPNGNADSSNSTLQHLKDLVEANITGATTALNKIAHILKEHFGKKVMILIDNFDEPVMRLINNTLNGLSLQRALLSLWNGLVAENQDYFIVMMIGVSRATTERLNNFHFDHFLNGENNFDAYFGFTEDEVHRLLTAKNIDKNQRNKIKEYFNGYKLLASQRNIYHPKGVLQYLQTKTLEYDQPISPLTSKLISTCLSHKYFFNHLTDFIRKEETPSANTRYFGDSHPSYLLHIAPTESLCDGYYKSPFADDGFVAFIETSRYEWHDGLSAYLSNAMMENKLKRLFHNFYRLTYNINICNSFLDTTIRSVLNSNTTTDKMLSDLADSIRQLLQPLQGKCRNEREIALIVHAALIYNLNFYKEVEVRNIDMDDSAINFIPSNPNTLRIPNPDRKILLLLEITADWISTDVEHTKMNHTIDKLAKYLPLKPREKSNIHLIKYLAIDINEKGDVRIEKGTNRHYY